jgi:hypothetical protein
MPSHHSKVGRFGAPSIGETPRRCGGNAERSLRFCRKALTIASMPADPIFGEAKPTPWARLTRLVLRSGLRTNTRAVRRTEQLDVLVPDAKADAVRAGLERWLGEHGVTSAVTTEDAGSGRTRIRSQLNESESAQLDLADPAVQAAFESLLADSI